jgi:hypothetical protein
MPISAPINVVVYEQYDRLPDLAAQLVGEGVALIFGGQESRGTTSGRLSDRLPL